MDHFVKISHFCSLKINATVGIAVTDRIVSVPKIQTV